MATTYIRTKEEYATIAALAREKFGDVLKLPMLRLNQLRDDLEMFTVPLRTDLCHLLFQRVPRDYNNTNGIQRAFKAEKITGVKKVSEDDPNYSAPGCIIATVQTTGRPWVYLEWDTDNRRGNLVVNLTQVESRLADLEPNEEGALQEELFKIGYMLDAHHRTEGHYQAGKMALEMSANIYLNLPSKEMARVFAEVNKNQDKPSPTHTIMMEYMAGMLKRDEKDAVDLAEILNKDQNSILYERIKTVDGRLPKGHRRTYVNVKTFTDLMTRYVLAKIPGSEFATKERVIENYFRGWKQVFPEAWADEDKHVLVKSMGFTIMSRLFPTVFFIASAASRSKAPSKDDFAKVVQTLRGMRLDPTDFADIELPGPIEVDWRSETFGGLSSGKGINMLWSVLDRKLNEHRLEMLEAS
jgi:DGQHR domain-containing protein